MADTASTRNRFRKLESGQYSNAWAEPQNEDFGSDRIDEALDGRVTFTLSTTKTLTSTNYETDEARMRFIDITSGTGGTVTIPAVEKWYIVRNATSGDVIFTTGGATTATVKSGNVSVIVTDGTSVYLGQNLDLGSSQLKSTATASASSHLVNKSTMDAAILAATMTAGGTSYAAGITDWLADPTSAKLRTAVTDESGSGALLFGTSPTITTPTIATPTITSGTVGTVASATGAAGLNVPHGTAPTSPVNGDVWTTTAGIYTRINGATVGPLIDVSSVPSVEWTQIGTTQTPSAVTSSSITSIPATYQDLLIEILGLSHDSGSSQTLRIELTANDTDWTAALNIGASRAAADTIYGSLAIQGYNLDAGNLSGGFNNLTSDLTTVSGAGGPVWRIAGGISGIRFSFTAGNFDGGSWKLWGK
jgi:hypothetical protein